MQRLPIIQKLATAIGMFLVAGNLAFANDSGGGTTDLDLSGVKGSFTVQWFNPRTGGALQNGSVKSVTGGGSVALGQPPAEATDDWAVLVRK